MPRFGPFTLSEHYRKVAVQVTGDNPAKKVLLYTSKPFVDSWAPSMSAWLGSFDGGFGASWPDYGKAVYYLDWTAIQAYPPEDCVPALPKGWTTWRFWQTSSRIRPLEFQNDAASGYDHNYDWGLFNGTRDDLLAWLGKPAPAPVLPVLSWQESIDAWARSLGFDGPHP